MSDGVYASLNGGPGSQDDPVKVAENRARMAAQMGVTAETFLTLHQIHSPDTVVASGPWNGSRPKADAIVTRTEGLAIGVTTADCGPILLVDPAARVIGAAHAGWKGALTGILRSCTRYVKSQPSGREATDADRVGRLLALLKDYNTVGLTGICDRDASAAG